MTTIDGDRLVFRPLSAGQALAIASWRYEAPYDFYNIDPTELEDEAGRMIQAGYFGVLDRSNELIAFRCFGQDGRVPGYGYDDTAVDTGGGLRPDLTGLGLGPMIVEAGLAFGRTLFGNVDFRITVAAFNERARRALGRAGFRPEARFVAPAGTEFLVLRRSAQLATGSGAILRRR